MLQKFTRKEVRNEVAICGFGLRVVSTTCVFFVGHWVVPWTQPICCAWGFGCLGPYFVCISNCFRNGNTNVHFQCNQLAYNKFFLSILFVFPLLIFTFYFTFLLGIPDKLECCPSGSCLQKHSHWTWKMPEDHWLWHVSYAVQQWCLCKNYYSPSATEVDGLRVYYQQRVH